MRLTLHAALLVSLAAFTSVPLAAVSAEEAARLGRDLTPLGGIKAGNADGTIPAWDGGLTAPPAGWKATTHHADPFASDQIVLTINAENMAKYADKLTEGHKAMLKAYPSFRMHIYPTRRSASSPQRIYDATKRIATTASIVNDGNGVAGAINGIPFPIPKSGIEVIWNHLLRFRSVNAARKVSQAAPTRSGSYTLVEFADEFYVKYSQEGMTEEQLDNKILLFKQEVLAPARLAGGILLVHETLNQVKEPRQAWLYNPGQRRVRRAPNVAYDNPGTASDGLRTNDQFDMFNGAPDRYDWKLVGRKELYVPYNSYKLHSGDVKYEDILKPLHVNPELLRYELHRVWVVEATLKSGARHIYKRRTLYVDEDSWQILAVDQYDDRGNLWRVSEGHPINYYNVPMFWTTLEVHTDLQAGRYIAIGLDNEGAPYQFGIKRSLDDYTPSALRRAGVR